MIETDLGRGMAKIETKTGEIDDLDPDPAPETDIEREEIKINLGKGLGLGHGRDQETEKETSPNTRIDIRKGDTRVTAIPTGEVIACICKLILRTQLLKTVIEKGERIRRRARRRDRRTRRTKRRGPAVVEEDLFSYPK